MGGNDKNRPKIQIQKIIAAKLSKYTTIRLACDIKDTHGHLRIFFGGKSGHIYFFIFEVKVRGRIILAPNIALAKNGQNLKNGDFH